MKIAILGDTHFGEKGNSEKVLDMMTDYIRNHFIPYVKENNVEAIIHMGDVFHCRSQINVLVENKVKDLFDAINKLNIQTYILVGNHDLYYKNNNDVFSTKSMVENFTVINKPEVIQFKDFKFSAIPWLSNEELYKQFLLNMREEVDYCFGHLGINGFKMNNNFKEENGIPKQVFAKVKKKVFSGHFHVKSEQGNVLYVGTPYEMDWNDHLSDKGFHILDTDDDSITFIQNTTSPRHIKIKSSEIKEKIEELKNNHIQVIYDIDNTADVQQILAENKPETFSTKDESLAKLLEQNDTFTIDNLKNVKGFIGDYIDSLTLADNIKKEKLLEYVDNVYVKVEKK